MQYLFRDPKGKEYFHALYFHIGQNRYDPESNLPFQNFSSCVGFKAGVSGCVYLWIVENISTMSRGESALKHE